jgi:hypothetical protein
MKPEEFIKTIYLGDRGCKKIEIDGWNEKIRIQVTEISRVRDVSGQWNFYNDENIVDGYIVFSDVKSFVFDPPGFIPNDEIELCSAEYIDENYYRFIVMVASCSEEGVYTRIYLTIEAKEISLEDPLKPGVKICE